MINVYKKKIIINKNRRQQEYLRLNFSNEKYNTHVNLTQKGTMIKVLSNKLYTHGSQTKHEEQ